MQVMQERLGKVDPLMIKAVGPMAGGSRVYSLCGALQAGIVVLGMLYGPEGEQKASSEALMESSEPVKAFYREFEKAFGSRLCHKITKADFNIPEERQKWIDRGGREECSRLCGTAVRILFNIIKEKGKTSFQKMEIELGIKPKLLTGGD
ncbi:MAG: C-GCAxxG-C-C family protein [Deltaproteobacteria bacterium]|nr:C-GCAxxG-C-C family protein [Deltaproteobacteria bacterium]